MRRIDLHCYPGTQEWVDSQGPFADALAQYWNKPWVGRAEDDVVADIRGAGLEAILVAFDIEHLTGAPPCDNSSVAAMRDRHPDVFIGAWGAVDPLKGEAAVTEAIRAAKEDDVLGFHFHPIMGHFRVDDPAYRPLFESISELGLPVMVDVGTTGMGAGLPGGLGAKISDAHPMAIDNLAADLPGLTIIASHPGYPWVDEMTECLPAQGQRVLGDVRLGTEVLPTVAEDRHPGPPPGQDHVRHRPSQHSVRAGPAGVGRTRLHRRGHGQGLPRQRRAGPRTLSLVLA